MAVAARRIDTQSASVRQARPPIAVVRTRNRVRSCDATAAARQNFHVFVVLIAVISVLGLGRVWLSVQAAEASLDASRLRSDIKTERYRGDMLEVQQSALSSPSRIRAIAGTTMDMAQSGEVTYIDLGPEAAVTKSPAPKRATAFERVLSDALSLAAGEAQVLLVGDVGLASAR